MIHDKTITLDKDRQLIQTLAGKKQKALEAVAETTAALRAVKAAEYQGRQNHKGTKNCFTGLLRHSSPGCEGWTVCR